MRTFRTALCVLALTSLISTSAALAAPVEEPSTKTTSVSSWVLSVLDSIIAHVTPESFGGMIDPSGQSSQTDRVTIEKPGKSPKPESPSAIIEKDGEPGQDPPDDEFGGVIEPNG